MFEHVGTACNEGKSSMTMDLFLHVTRLWQSTRVGRVRYEVVVIGDLLLMHLSREESNEPNRGQPEISMTRQDFTQMPTGGAVKRISTYCNKHGVSRTDCFDFIHTGVHRAECGLLQEDKPRSMCTRERRVLIPLTVIVANGVVGKRPSDDLTNLVHRRISLHIAPDLWEKREMMIADLIDLLLGQRARRCIGPDEVDTVVWTEWIRDGIGMCRTISIQRSDETAIRSHSIDECRRGKLGKMSSCTSPVAHGQCRAREGRCCCGRREELGWWQTSCSAIDRIGQWGSSAKQRFTRSNDPCREYLAYEMTAIDANLRGLVKRLLGLGDEDTPPGAPVDGPPTTVVVKMLERRDKVLFIIDICANDMFCGCRTVWVLNV
jgi:hypothetical protein